MLVHEIEFAVFQPKVTATHWWKLRQKRTFQVRLGADIHGQGPLYDSSVYHYKVYQGRIEWLVGRGGQAAIHRFSQFFIVLA